MADLTNKPWPTLLDMFPCGCSPTAKRGEHCTKKWIRCNVRLAAVQEWRAKQPDKKRRGE
jgi:hypothetical protein